MELNDKLLEKAKDAKSAEELFSLAKENGIELTEEEAKTYFAQINSKKGELTDDELDNVSGGGKCGTIYYENRPVISALNSCDLFRREGTLVQDGGYCKDCCFSRTVGTSAVTALLVCLHDERYDN